MRLISDQKIEQFKEELKKRRIDVALFLTSEPIHDVNIEYFTGFQQVRFFSFSCLLISQNNSVLVVSPLSYDQALMEAEADEIINLRDYGNSLTKILKEKLRRFKTVGIIEKIFPYKLSKKFKVNFKDISDIILELRSQKEPKEIKRIEKACHITNQGIKFIERNLSKKMTEKELVLALEQKLIKKGADELAFPTIVTSGNKSSFIHPHPSFTNKKIQKGLGLIDFGVRYKSYCSDVTVPFTVSKLLSKQRKIVKTVEKAYAEAINTVKVGIPTWKVHDSAEKIINRNRFLFKHSVGHGIGLDLHDLPSLSPKPKVKEGKKDWKEFKLKENMTFTIEPGVYELGIGGIRLENDILTTKNNTKFLTESRLITL
jgi:Xaa-Pro aminopeptidase